MNYRTLQLDSGITLATAEMPFMESICMGIWAPVGSRHETPELNGIAHFTEHLLFKGTHRRNAQQISIDIESVGGSVNAYTAEDQTCYHVSGPAASLPRLSNVLTDMFIDSTFPEDEINRERVVIEEEIAMYRDQPSDHIEDLLSATMWPNSSLGQPITGTEESIRGLTRDHFVEFTRNNYASRNIIVAVAGKITHDTAVEHLASLFEDNVVGSPLEFARYTNNGSSGSKPRITVVERDVEQAHVSIGFHSPGRHDDKRHALKLLNVILGENMSSRLWQELREKRGLCYTVETDLGGFEETGLFDIYAALDPTNLKEAMRLIFDQLSALKSNGPSEEELEQARDYTIGQSLVSLESTSSQAMWLGDSLISYGRVLDPEETRNDLRKVNTSDIQKLAAAIFVESNLGVAFIGPTGSAASDMESMVCGRL